MNLKPDNMATSVASEELPIIPQEVIDAYGIDQSRCSKLGSGLVNLTFCVETANQKIVLQRLPAGTPTQAIEDFETYTRHLKSRGWDTPSAFPTRYDQSYFYDHGQYLWRGMSYIDCDPAAPQQLNDNLASSIGAMLSAWHTSMSSLAYTPKYQIPFFHDTGHHISKLEACQDVLPDDNCKELADSTLVAFSSLPELPQGSSQLIHGDPKLDNILFRDKQPFTLIDLDTVMTGSFWLDVGDLIRSLLKTKQADRQESSGIIRGVSTGYSEMLGQQEDIDEFSDIARLATQHISLELISRYLNDTVDSSYFTWDQAQFRSRAENHFYRASNQWRMYKNIAV